MNRRDALRLRLMWFSEKALVFVDTRSAALAVYKETFSGRRLLRFASERFGSGARSGALFKDVLEDSRGAIAKLARDLAAPMRGACLLLPIGVPFPSIIDAAGLNKGRSGGVDEEDLVAFRMAPLLPFPVSQAVVRSETSPGLGPGVVLAQAILKSVVTESEKVMGDLGFKEPEVSSALSAALRGLPKHQGIVDLIFGDSACAIAVRDERGGVEAIHLRLLVEGDDRAQRSIDEAFRATRVVREIRVLGEDDAALRARAGEALVRPAFSEGVVAGLGDPQRFPFLSVFQPASSI